MMLDYKYENTDYYTWINIVVNHAVEQYHTEVDLVAEEDSYAYTFKQNKINVMGATPPRDKLYILLHEVGHVSRMLESIGDSTFFMDKAGEASMKEKTMTLMEEVLAWHRGEAIARRLSIPIEPRPWQRLMNKSIDKYVKWINE